METINLDSWSCFADAVDDIRKKYGTRERHYPEVTSDPLTFENDILYRGISDSEWGLRTTLERTVDLALSVQDYLLRISQCVHEIESTTGRNWNLPDYPEILKKIESTQDSRRIWLPHYSFLVYLRHHGFPSPLLDWTLSPFIAAYFAFEAVPNSERVAIFAFIERPDGTKSFCGDSPMITTHGPYVTTHSRHFAQKAWYTTASIWNSNSQEHRFCPHSDVSHSTKSQDVLIKLTIPSQDRAVALRQLEEFNINHYSLFRTEDALIRTMGLRTFGLRDTVKKAGHSP